MVYSYSLKTRRREELIDITDYVRDSIKKSNLSDGILVVFVPHTTAAVTINENADPSVKKDITTFLAEKVQQSSHFSHVEGNADSHIKSSLIGPSLTLIVEDGKLLLGTWQGIYFYEFDGPRNRTFLIKTING
ncbi:MAG: secondary thiamine-phosphate synthase enzyme YjbQ [Defluviitoga tunisiensis]